MKNVVSINKGKQIRLAAQLAPSDGDSLFDIPFDDIISGSDAANGDNSDPVAFGARAELALRRVFSKFGFDRLPENRGELMGGLLYCHTLHCMEAGCRTGDGLDDSAFNASCKSLARREPREVETFTAYHNGDIAMLRRLHNEHDYLRYLGETFDELKEFGYR